MKGDVINFEIKKTPTKEQSQKYRKEGNKRRIRSERPKQKLRENRSTTERARQGIRDHNVKGIHSYGSLNQYRIRR